MNNENIDFRKELASAPFHRNGFNDALRKRIEHKMNEKAKPSLTWVPFAVGLCMILGFLFIYMPLNEQAPEQQTAATNMQDAPPEEMGMFKATGTVSASRDSALLLAFRNDHGNSDRLSGSESTYRTMLISHEDGEMELTAQGHKLIVPYGQQFWEITPITHPVSRSIALWAHPIEQDHTAPIMANEDTRLVHREKVLFAGNRYVSIRDHIQSNQRSYTEMWVKEFPELDPWQNPSSSNSEEPHSYVSMQMVFGGDLQGDHWQITRGEGLWKAQMADVRRSTTGDIRLAEVEFSLPASVVMHDQLAVPWSDIQAIEPDAIDAVSSPSNDMLAVLTKNVLQVYPLHDGKVVGEALIVEPLSEDEHLIMNQWALDKYVPIWKEKVREYLAVP